MDRRAALRLSGNVAALVAVAALVFVGAQFAIPGGVIAPGGPSRAPLATLPPPLESPLVRPAPSPTLIAVTNLSGPAANGVDDYPFVTIARLLPDFAGLWVERNQRDFHIAVTGDLETAITAIQPHLPSAITVYFQPAAYTYAELDAIVSRVFSERDALLAAGISVSHGAVSEKQNVIELGIAPLTPEVMAMLRARYTQAIQFEFAPTPPPLQNDPWPTAPERLVAMVKSPANEWLTCGRRAFPASALEGPTGAENLAGPSYDALRQAFEVFGGEFGSGSWTWLVAEMDETGATFLARSGNHWIDVTVSPENGEWGPDGMGECQPRTVLGNGLGSTEWALDPKVPAPTATDTEMRILVWDMACTGGRPTTGRMAPPLVEYLDTSLVMTIGVTPIPGGGTCIGPPGTPVLVMLPEPIGDRELLDGGIYPPGPPTGL